MSFDQQLFLLINHLPHSFFVDQIALFLSAVSTWGAVWLVLALFLFLREERKDHWFFLPVILVVLGGFISEFIVKTMIARPRPAWDMGAIIVGTADNFSFPSSHAFFAFAFAYILSHEEPKLKIWFYALAGFISLSRIYLGVHYPSDVIGGSILGIIIGWFSLMLENSVRPKSTRRLPKLSRRIR